MTIDEQSHPKEPDTSPAASDHQGQASDRPLVNYIWINRQRKAAVDVDNPVCAIEMANIKRALDNANKYPKADFQLWVDKKLLDVYSLFCLDCFMQENARHGNVTLCDLQDIPDYAKDRYFEPLAPENKGYVRDSFNSTSGSRNIHSRADLARILVLDHCMRSRPERNRLIYSDIDCPDLRLREALPVMNQHGIVIHDLGELVVSHGYIGIATDNINVRRYFNVLKSLTEQAAHQNGFGFGAFKHFVEALHGPNEFCHRIVGLPELLPPMSTTLPHIPYAPPPDKLKKWKSSHQSQAKGAVWRN